MLIEILILLPHRFYKTLSLKKYDARFWLPHSVFVKRIGKGIAKSRSQGQSRRKKLEMTVERKSKTGNEGIEIKVVGRK